MRLCYHGPRFFSRRQSLKRLQKEYPLARIKRILSQFRSIKTLVIGDAIVDEYHFTLPKGRAMKDPILSVQYVAEEAYAGGVLAVTNHVSNFVDHVTCITALGDRDNKRHFISNALRKNVRTKFFIKENAPTTVKKRYLNIQRNEKLFNVEYMNDSPLSKRTERLVIRFLQHTLPHYDLVLVADFGHGFITDAIVSTLEEHASFLAVNAQSNSANLGFNYVTKYRSPTFATMDIQELRYAVVDRFSNVEILMDKLNRQAGFAKFLVTMSKDGSGYFYAGEKTFFPAFVTRPKDTVGAGDAIFPVISLFAYRGYDTILPFIANCVGAIAVSYLGNKESITKKKLQQFITHVYGGAVVPNC